MNLFKTKLTSNQLTEKISTFDSHTAEIQAELSEVSAELEAAYEQTAESSVTGQPGPGKVKLKSLRDKKNDLQGELQGRQKVRSKLESELAEAVRREELEALANQKKQGTAKIEELGRTAVNLTNALRKVFDALDKIRGVERELPRNGGEYFVRPSEIVVKNLQAALNQPHTAEKLYGSLDGLSSMLTADLDRWEQAQARRIEEKHNRIAKEAGI